MNSNCRAGQADNNSNNNNISPNSAAVKNINTTLRQLLILNRTANSHDNQ